MSLIVSAAAAALASDALPAAAPQSESEQAMLKAWKEMVLKHENFTKHTDGEDMTWQMTPYLRATVKMAEALEGDRECLDTFCKAFEHIMSTVSADIDGLVGWPTTQGNYGKHGKRCVIMDDAHICEPVGDFVRLVKRNEALKGVYGERATAYLKFVEEKVFPKWADFWLELKDKTVTLQWEGAKGKKGEVLLPEPSGVYLFPDPGKKPGMSLPLNQFWSVARCYLALHDATGKPEYLGKATKMARTGKFIYLERDGERVRPWCYWRPAYEGDFKPEGEPVKWCGPHPERSGYANFETGMMAEFHQRKIVFSDEDIQRVVRLQLDFQWNKDEKNPKFEYKYDRRAGYTKPYPSMLWSSLAYFDPTIARMTAPSHTAECVAPVAGTWRGIAAVPAYFQRKLEAASPPEKPTSK